MRIKKYLDKCIRGLYYQLKGIGMFALVPVFVLYILLPVMNIFAYHFQGSGNIEQLYDNILRMGQYFIPLMSVWWLLFVLEHYIEEPMHELLYLDYRVKLGEFLLLYFSFLVLMIPPFLIYTRIFPVLWWLFLKLAIMNLFYFASAYGTSYFLGKIIPGVILVIFYTIYVIAAGRQEGALFMLSLLTGQELWQAMWGYLLAALLLLLLGGISNYYFIEKPNE